MMTAQAGDAATQVRFGLEAGNLLNPTDAEFVGSVKWRNTLPGPGGNGDQESALRTIGMCWKQQCQDRALPSLKIRPLHFATLDRTVQQAQAGSLFAVLDQLRNSLGRSKAATPETAVLAALDEWLAAAATQTVTDPMTLLGCCELLLFQTNWLSAETTGRLWRVTLSGAIAQADSFATSVEGVNWESLVGSGEGDAVDDQWLRGGLLSWTCGLLFDDVKGAPSVAKLGRSGLNNQLLDVTDSVGIPDAAVISDLQTQLSRWSDALLVAEIFERSLWKTTAETRFNLLLKNAAALVQSDGGFSGSDFDDVRAAALLLGVAELNEIESRSVWLKCVARVEKATRASSDLRKSAAAAAKSAAVGAKLPRAGQKDIPSWQSDESEFACLRTDWSPDATLATLAYSDEVVSLALQIDGSPLFEGLWEIDVQEDGESLEMAAEWECVCWYSVDDVDYCELQIAFEGGPKIDRFLMLHRTGQYAIFADIVTEAGGQRLDIVNRLPLVPGVQHSVVSGTREQRLTVGPSRVRVCPLALPHDAGLGTSGRIDVETDEDGDARLVIETASANGVLFSPVLLDWSPERRKSDVEWSPLTVTEAGKVTPASASAYRIRIGTQSLVLFRAFCRTDRYRTVLGYVTDAETVIGEFSRKGDLSELLLVQQ